MDSSFYSSQVVFTLQGGFTLEKKSEPSCVFLLNLLVCIALVIGKKSGISFVQNYLSNKNSYALQIKSLFV